METNNNTELAGVMRRVQKLLAIAQDDRADPNEAAAAAQQAEKIMRKYQLDHVDIMRAEFAREENFDTVDAIVMMKPNPKVRPTKVPRWAQWIAVQCATLHDCQVRTAETPRGVGLRFAGYRADTAVCGWTFDYLISAVIRGCRAYQREAHRERVESEAYRTGFVMSITAALKRAIAAKAAEQQAESAGRELVLIKAHAVAQRFGEVKYGQSKTRTRDADAFSRGKRDGAVVDIGRRAINGSGSTGVSGPLRLAA